MKLIILDRDGVINQDSDSFIKSPEEWVPIPGSLEAIARLHRAGYRVVVATNQSGLGRGLFDIIALNAIHQKMHTAVRAAGGIIDSIFFCPHTISDNCDCRKPRQGMFNAIAKRYDVSLEKVPSVGDSLRDLQAGFLAGCQPILVMTGKGQLTHDNGGLPPETIMFDSLAAVANHLLDTETEIVPEKAEKNTKS
ncbi:D-glycero-beta-D-manno-heptose 1,7-bisphosphate 7-phosphatase [Oxalobacter sp. OttesenSCG-928-P03]|nr:D-glycero-beta-D-manno-heptose 1,7-bisphosphate 7-phosphatase [Oxalobacter sp. OttesenSCG-928-P03]